MPQTDARPTDIAARPGIVQCALDQALSPSETPTPVGYIDFEIYAINA